MDRAVLDAYDWTDIPTGCEFLDIDFRGGCLSITQQIRPPFVPQGAFPGSLNSSSEARGGIRMSDFPHVVQPIERVRVFVDFWNLQLGASELHAGLEADPTVARG
jgi:hypothetical protein